MKVFNCIMYNFLICRKFWKTTFFLTSKSEPVCVALFSSCETTVWTCLSEVFTLIEFKNSFRMSSILSVSVDFDTQIFAGGVV